MNLYALLAAAIAAAFLAAAVTASIYSARIENIKAEAREQLDIQRAKVDEANLKANTVAAEFERWKKTHKAEVVIVEKEVARVLQANPEWSGTPIPDSVRDQLAKLPAGTSAAELVDGMRSVQQPYTGQ
jgi:hypothetical protein